jgi:hypothetical protein
LFTQKSLLFELGLCCFFSSIWLVNTAYYLINQLGNTKTPWIKKQTNWYMCTLWSTTCLYAVEAIINQNTAF